MTTEKEFPSLHKAKEAFRFYDRLHLTELTGLRAMNLHEFVQLLKIVPESFIYFHTHQFLQQYQDIAPVPANDFAWWITEVLGDSELGEQLSSIDTIQFPTLESLRESIVTVIEDHLNKRPTSKLRFADDANIFYFLKSVSFIFPTPYSASDLQEFIDALDVISSSCLYFHVFESRLRSPRSINDFSWWLRTSMDEPELADRIARLDPYTYSLDSLKKTIRGIIKWKLLTCIP